MWELDYKESWAPKNWCFWTVVSEKILESPLDCKDIQSVHSKEISPGCSLVRLILKLKLQYFGHLTWRADSFEKTLMLEKIEGRRRRGWQRMRWLEGITDSLEWVWGNSGSWWCTGRPGVLQFMGLQRVGHDWATELNWTELNSLTEAVQDGKCHFSSITTGSSGKRYKQTKCYIATYWKQKRGL